MRTGSKTKFLLVHAILAVLLLSACSGGGKPVLPPGQAPASSQVWPQSPETPRIAWVASFERPEDLGIQKSILGKLSDWIFGGEDIRIIQPMAVLAVGNLIYVADPGIKAVHRFDLKLQQHTLIRRKDGQPLISPVALTHDQAGTVYIADSALAQVFRASAGTNQAIPMALGGKLGRPTGLVMDKSGRHLFVVDTANHQLRKYRLNGSLVKTIGKRGTGKAQFNYPTMIWRDGNGHLLVTDSLNFRIQQFDENGRFVSMFGKHGDGTGNFSRPKGVATDKGGHVYVVDSLFHAVQIFDTRGHLLLNFGSHGNAQGEFWLPTGMYIDSGNTIYVADSRNRRIQVFRYIGGQS